MPNDLRINPFIGTNFVRLTEKHIVPNVSPFVIRTNEVPERHDPSNVEMTYVSDVTGKSNGVRLTEVAAMPRQGEYRLDYGTGTMGDDNWNTGLVEFNEADAGKIIEIKYTGTGELASLKSNHYPAWWNDRGDGSDGDFIPTENTTIKGVKQYRNVFIKNGITVTIDSYALILCQETFINRGNIIVSHINNGGAGGSVIDTGDSESSNIQVTQGGTGGDGYASYGGAGGGCYKRIQGKPGGKILLDGYGITSGNRNGAYYGAGGGAGGVGDRQNVQAHTPRGGGGGGCITIVATTLENNNITANGEAGESSSGYSSSQFKWPGAGGGGGGGYIALIAKTITKRGIVNVNGGAGGKGSPSGEAQNGVQGGNGLVLVKEMGII